MSIKKRLLATLGILFLIMIGISVFSVFMLNLVNQQSTVIAAELIPDLNSAQDLNFDVARYRSTEFKHIVLTTDKDMTDAETQMDNYQKLVDEKLQTIKSEEDPGIDEAIAKWEKYKTLHTQFITMSRNLDSDGAIKLMMGDMKPLYDALSKYAQDRVDSENLNIQNASKAGDIQYLQSLYILIITSTIAIGIGIFMGTVLLRAIMKPLKKFQDELTILAANGGDLTKTIDVTSKDEMGDMASALNRFLQNLREIISEVNQNADAVMESSVFVKDQMTSLSGDLSDSSATTEELSASMEETSASAQQISSSSTELVEAVSSLAERAAAGANMVNDISKRASELKYSATNSRSVAVGTYEDSKQKLELAIKRSEAIEEINHLSNSIMEISNQTNLLALNASIEAARAGDSGKGFAVVASEIGSLADNSKSTVTEIQKITKDVVDAVRDLSQGTTSLIEFMDKTVIGDYNSFVNVGEAYGKDAGFVDELVSEISATSQELTATIEGIMRTIEDVSQAMTQGATGTQDVASQVTKIAQIAEEVESHSTSSQEKAQKLKDTVGKFTV
ncbi:MAG: methyl-accepting chemotaxis protein [Butyrivibrio sp.]|nr:methyl-accepting chemotaxis protein [Butyrivibrio sp.]